MTPQRDGGPAFPRPAYYPADPGDRLEDSERRDLHTRSQAGMTLRDWFAGQALAGLLAQGSVPLPFTETYQRHGLGDSAALAYEIADAMLHAREGGAR